MKLFEFFQSQYPDKTIKQVKTEPDVGPILSKTTVSGDVKRSSGKYASAYENKTDPSSIFKIGKTANYGFVRPEQDPYLSYINKIKNIKIPVFPQIHSIQIYQHSDTDANDTEYCFKVNMERLYEPGDIDEKEAAHLVYRLIGRELTEEELQIMKNHQNKYIWLFSAILLHLAWFGHAKEVDYIPTLNINLKDVKDRYMRLACSVIKSMLKTKKHRIDLHTGNIMYRRTPYGPQPVITDPLAD